MFYWSLSYSHGFTEVPLDTEESPSLSFTAAVNLSVRSVHSYQRIDEEEEIVEKDLEERQSLDSYALAMESGDM